MADTEDSARGANEPARYLLGLDTGGTYTDAVLIEDTRLAAGPAAVVAKAKALTTPQDLACGIGAAVTAVTAPDAAADRPDGIAPERIALVSLSTTLATNALVEGRGGRVGLVMIGFDFADFKRAGLAEALGNDPLILLAGGHDALGAEKATLDLNALAREVADLEVDGFAICSHFAVRNAAHELRAREAIRAATDRPVTCSHELSPHVGGPRRALTALLNARLIGMIAGLIDAAGRLLESRGITAPLMIVRGDGALVSAGFARTRPVETILSGPAASLVGASFLTGLADAVVSDIGGTTTDIAVMSEGRPRLDPAGATVGGWRTMVEAVAVTTHGLGGDSEVALDETGGASRLTLGPRRVVPVALFAHEAPELVHATLDRQLGREVPDELDGRFLLPMPGAHARHGLGRPETALLAALGCGPAAADTMLRSRVQRASLHRLVSRGLVTVAGLTPSDAAHVLGRHSGWDREAAVKAVRLMARRRTSTGRPLAGSAEILAERILAGLVRRSAELVLDVAFARDGWREATPSQNPIARAALDGHKGLVRPRVELTVPLIGLGAPAAAYYPGVALLLSTTDATPLHADVANAIGAVIGHVRIERTATVTCPAEGRYRLHLATGIEEHRSFEAARAAGERALAEAVRKSATEAGAAEAELAFSLDLREAEVEGRRMLVEARITAVATGRPRLSVPPETASGLPSGFTGI